MKKQVRIVVRGRVQGVGFRAYTEATAARLGVHGYVRNRTDGSVEVVAEGDEGAVDQLVAWARNGPSMARVDRIDVEPDTTDGPFNDFRVRY